MNIEKIVELLNNDLSNEYMHMHFYIAASTNVRGLHRVEIGDFFNAESSGEKMHVEAFRRLIMGLITRRKLEANVASHPTPYNSDLTCPIALLKEALAMEDLVVANYVNRIDDAIALQENGGEDKVDGKWIELFLEDQIADSRADADKMRGMLENFGHKN
jgi:ferritin